MHKAHISFLLICTCYTPFVSVMNASNVTATVKNSWVVYGAPPGNPVHRNELVKRYDVI